MFLKAARLNGTILLRGMAWAESTDAVYYHDYHRECGSIHQRSPNTACAVSTTQLFCELSSVSTSPIGEQAVNIGRLHVQVPAAAGRYRERNHAAATLPVFTVRCKTKEIAEHMCRFQDTNALSPSAWQGHHSKRLA